MDSNGGLMQITERTAAYYGVDSLYPKWRTSYKQNAEAGMYILRKKIDEQGGDVWEGVRAYNGAGESAEWYKERVRQNSQTIPQNTGDADTTSSGNTERLVAVVNSVFTANWIKSRSYRKAHWQRMTFYPMACRSTIPSIARASKT